MIATMKSLGATGGRVFAIYLIQVHGARADRQRDRARARRRACRSSIAWGFGAVIPLPIEPALQPDELWRSRSSTASLTALAFALWPLGRAHDVPVVGAVPRRGRAGAPLAAPRYVDRDRARGRARSPRSRCCSPTTGASRRSSSARPPRCSSALRLVATLVMARRAHALPRPRSTVLRLAIANIHRPGRADADRRAVARARPRGAGHRDR